MKLFFQGENNGTLVQDISFYVHCSLMYMWIVLQIGLGMHLSLNFPLCPGGNDFGVVPG